MEDQATAAVATGLGMIGIVYLAIAVLMIVSIWKLFTKAGKPGWASIVPIYNLIVMLEVAGKPLWFIVLFLIPVANLVAAIMTYLGLAKSFGKGGGFAVGLLLLPIIFFPILAFGSSTHQAAQKA